VAHQTQRASLRVFALSDIHVDMKPNMAWLQALSATDYADAALILAGDISDNLATLREALSRLCNLFTHVFFVPGNHELWVRRQEFSDSIAKFWYILQLCDTLGVHTTPTRVGTVNGTDGVWIVPLFSWYMRPEEGGGSLFVPKAGEDPSLQMWSDNYFIRWPSLGAGVTAADYFLRLNEAHLAKHYDTPVISFSHFLPRTDLIFSTPAERNAAGIRLTDPAPRFNFSRVAGCVGIEEQIRRLGAKVHVYGHQHRNRDRIIDGVRYVSRCLGYPREQQRYDLPSEGPILIWEA
jgi:predicted phosphodiesterase